MYEFIESTWEDRVNTCTGFYTLPAILPDTIEISDDVTEIWLIVFYTFHPQNGGVLIDTWYLGVLDIIHLDIIILPPNGFLTQMDISPNIKTQELHNPPIQIQGRTVSNALTVIMLKHVGIMSVSRYLVTWVQSMYYLDFIWRHKHLYYFPVSSYI